MGIDFEKALAHIINCWQAKMAVSVGVSCLTFLFGELDVAFLALWVLVLLDLFSKWACITKKHIQSTGNKMGWTWGFINAWETGALSSHEMRYGFIPKVGMYIFTLIAAHMLSIITPQKVFAGVDWSSLPDTVTAIYLGITEFVSINENFVCMGYGFLAPLSGFFRKKASDMVGSSIGGTSYEKADTSANQRTGAE